MRKNKYKKGKDMAIYIIGDLHLSFAKNKPMSIFGTNWENHSEKIKEDWLQNVNTEDTVILAGDFSWAMHLKDAYLDFQFIHNLPGKKILLKGNHDYWWTTITKMKEYLQECKFTDIEFLYNNSIKVEDKIFIGTRGWNLLETQENEKMLNREIARLRLSIQDGLSKITDEEMIAIFHYPPLSRAIMKNQTIYPSPFLQEIKKYPIHRCYYGHLHGKSHIDAVEGEIENIQFQLISADYLNFHLEKIDK